MEALDLIDRCTLTSLRFESTSFRSVHLRTNWAQAGAVSTFVIGLLRAHPARQLNRSAFGSNRDRNIAASSGSSKQ